MKNPPSFCNRCGLCNSVCPVFRAYRGREMFGPRFKIKLLHADIKDKVFFLCTDCGKCSDACPNNIEMDFVEHRKKLFSAGIVPVSLLNMVEKMKEHRDPYHDER